MVLGVAVVPLVGVVGSACADTTVVAEPAVAGVVVPQADASADIEAGRPSSTPAEVSPAQLGPAAVDNEPHVEAAEDPRRPGLVLVALVGTLFVAAVYRRVQGPRRS